MTVLSWLCRVYRLLLRAYPAEFRARYADEMTRVFRDRGREIVHSGGTWGLVGYSLSTGKDWFVSVLRERMDSMHIPSFSTLRWVFLFCIALDLVLLKRQATPATWAAPLPFALLIMYGLLVLWATIKPEVGRGLALRTGTLMGLISGAILTIWTVGGHYFLPSTGIAPVVFASTCIAIIFGCWSIAGYRGGWLAGCWSGIVCVLVKVTCAFVLASTPLPGETFVRVLVAGGQHLLEGPVIGAMLGAIAGVAARIFGKWQSSLPAVGLAGGK